MNEFDFARTFLNDFKVRDSEIIPIYCPFCNGGDSRDKFTFALNYENHTFNCKRGSCDRHGHFSELCREHGVEMDRQPRDSSPPVRRKYRRPQVTMQQTDKVTKYLQLRGVSSKAAEAFGITGDGENIVFPYYRTQEEYAAASPTFVKYRKPVKYTGEGSKMWREKDAEPILFGMHLCDPKDPILYLFEGEFDCICAWQITGRNCVSVPSGCEDFTWLEICYEWLHRFETIAVFADNDAAGKKMLDALSRKLDFKMLRPEFDYYSGCKDCNEIYVRYGPEVIKTIMDHMKPVEVTGLLNLAEVENVDLTEIPRTMTGIPKLDRLTGGMLAGDLSVWTGKRGEGKSTLLTQLMLEAVDKGTNVCIYSGEIPANRLKYWINLQAAGSTIVQKRHDEKADRDSYYVPSGKLEKILSWYNGKIWVYDNKTAEADETAAILRLFELAYKRYDCRVFVVDNLMIVNTTSKDRDVMQIQADFLIRLRKLAETLGVHIHVVVHPRKTVGDIKDSDSVSGLGTITNVACNVFSIHRCGEKEQRETGCDSILTCLKNRAFGTTGDVRLLYHEQSRRFVELGSQETAYGWQFEKIIDTTWGSIPF